jgi:hypothetical protein
LATPRRSQNRLTLRAHGEGVRADEDLVTHAVRTLPLSALDADSIDAWRRLADRATGANPFFRPEFVLANLESCGDDGILVCSRRCFRSATRFATWSCRAAAAASRIPR